MSPFDEDPSENKSELDLCIDEIHDLQTKLVAEKEKNKWMPVEERMPIEEKVYEILDIVRGTAGFSLFQKPAWDNPWRSTKSLGEIRTITHWREINMPEDKN